MSKKAYKTQVEIIDIVRDYIKSGDSIKTVAQRHGASYPALAGWLKRLQIPTRRNAINWDNVKKEVYK